MGKGIAEEKLSVAARQRMQSLINLADPLDPPSASGPWPAHILLEHLLTQHAA